MRNAILPPIILAILGGCTLVPADTAAAPEPHGDRLPAEYAVYSAVLDAFERARPAEDGDEGHLSFGADVDHLYAAADVEAHLVADVTSGVLIFGLEGDDLILTSMARMEGIPGEAVADYAAVNEEPRSLDPGAFTTRVPIAPLSAVDPALGRVMAGARGYPEPLPAPGHVTFSRVGFSPDGGTAVLFANFQCGARCGHGQILVVEREDGRWRVRQAETIIRY